MLNMEYTSSYQIFIYYRKYVIYGILYVIYIFVIGNYRNELVDVLIIELIISSVKNKIISFYTYYNKTSLQYIHFIN